MRKWIIRICFVFFAVIIFFGVVDLNNEISSLKKTNSKNDEAINALQKENTELHKNLTDLKELTRVNSDLKIKLDFANKTSNDLQKTVDNLVKDNNNLRETVKQAVQAGVAKPNVVGITPSFTVTSRGSSLTTFSRSMDGLSRGLYQHRQINVSFNINNKEKWIDAGNWYVSRYTATVGECDSNPSMTADSKLVTPGFTVAVDPKHWKYGTIFYFEGLGFGVAADCGGGVKGKKRADFLVSSKKFSSILTDHRQVWVVYIPK